MNRLIVLLVAVACISYPVLSLAGEAQDTAGGANRATTVKSGKSNSSDRAGGAGETVVEGTTVKSSKSNSSERVGGSGETAAEGSKVKGSKSNSSERSTTVKGSKSNSDN